MALENPPIPSYGPDLFVDLQEVSRVLRDNDAYLQSQINNLGPTPTLDVQNLTLAGGYSSHAGFVYPRTSKRLNIVYLMPTMILCPPQSYATGNHHIATVAAAHRAPYNVITSAVANSSSGFVLLQFQINTNGNIYFWPATSLSTIYYILLPPMTWGV